MTGPFMLTCSSKFGTFKIVPVYVLGMQLWQARFGDEKLGDYDTIAQAIDALRLGTTTHKPSGSVRSEDAALPVAPDAWRRRSLEE